MSLLILIARAIISVPAFLEIFLKLSNVISKEALERADTERFDSHSELIRSLRLSNPSEDEQGSGV